MNVTLRLATVADAAALSDFARATFIDWYLPDNRPEDVEAHVRSTYSAALQAAELAAPGQHVMLAESADGIAGYGFLVASRPCAALAGAMAPAELRRFYVGRRWHGSGIAPRLMTATLAHARTLAASHVWLTCWERNPRALAFYKKCGFLDIGTTTFTVGTDVQTDRLLAVTL